MAEQDLNEVKEKNYSQFFEEHPPHFEEIDTEAEGISEDYMNEAVRVPEECDVDITDHNIYAIQTSKLRTEEDHRLKLAEEKKKEVKLKIDNLREAFLHI
jgi:hypothetical protein